MESTSTSSLRLLRQQLRKRDTWTRQRLEQHQLRTLKALRAYATTYSPFYQRFHQGLADSPLHELPVLTKSLVMEHFDELITDPEVRLRDVEAHMTTMQVNSRFRNRYRTVATSGSTGQRGIFLFDEADWLVLLAAYMRAMEDWTNLTRPDAYTIKSAGVSSATPWHPSASVNASLVSRLSPMLGIDATERLESMVARLNSWQPELIIGYPSSLSLLAHEQLTEHLQIAPRAIITSSEVAVDKQQQAIRNAWGENVFNMYGTTEGGCVAMECDRHTGLHLFEDLLIVEVVDRDNQPVPPGVMGDKVLITVLFNHTQPLIRYQLNDRIQLQPAACPCGRPYTLIEAIEGRLEQVLYFSGLDGKPRPVHPNVFHRVLEGVPCLGWKVVQEVSELHILLSGVPDTFTPDRLKQDLQREMEGQRVRVPPIAIQHVPDIPREKSGKISLIISQLPEGQFMTWTPADEEKGA